MDTLVQMCKISHFRTPAHMQNVCNVHGVAAKKFFAKKKCGNVCESADVRNFACPHTCTLAKCVQRALCGCQSFFFAKKFLEMCVKVRMCEILHFRSPARVRNVCNVHCVAAGVFFYKFFFVNVCESAVVRNFARPHTRTRAKCVQWVSRC